MSDLGDPWGYSRDFLIRGGGEIGGGDSAGGLKMGRGRMRQMEAVSERGIPPLSRLRWTQVDSPPSK